MPEPNEKMSELLKRYVAQRKAELRADFELHPATRHLLRGEVARTFGKTDDTGKMKSLLLMLWPRLAIAGAFTAMLVVTVIVLNKPQREMKVAQSSTGTMVPAPVQSRVVEETKPVLDASADGTASPNREIAAPPPASTAKLFAIKHEDAARARALAKESRSEAKLSEPILQPVPAERKNDVLAGKKGPAKSKSAETFARTKSVAGSVVTAAPQSPATASAKTFFADAEAQNRWQFVQQDSRVKYRQNLLSPAQPKILQSFELVRTGNGIRLIENDGSIYEGKILAAAQYKLDEKDSAAGRDQTSEFDFRAVGTNQQLNRIVTFTGNFAFRDDQSKEDAPSGASQLGALAKQKVDAQIGIIQGKVSIAGTNEFQIRATTESVK
jgi:hypothetical protein